MCGPLAAALSTLHLVLAEAAVELVPEPLWSHPAVARHAKARKKAARDTLLDDTHHHAAMKAVSKAGGFEDLERRGRPDILHTTLLVALESRLNKEGRLRIHVHTRNEQLIAVAPELRIQRAQHRFYGLLEQLLVTGRVPPDPTAPELLTLTDHVTLESVVTGTGAEQVIVFDEAGDEAALPEAFGDAKGDVAIVVGCFPTGAFRSQLGDARRVALGREPLTAWAVAGEALVAFRS